MTEKKRKLLYYAFKIASVLVSCLFPVIAIIERFPLWKVSHGRVLSIGTGGILAALVIIIVFRRTVFNFLRDKLNLKHAPPILIWGVLLALSYFMMYVSVILRDINIVFWMGLIGCGIGTVLTFVAENYFGKKDNNG
jgi:uncharacterized membrane protein YczE